MVFSTTSTSLFSSAILLSNSVWVRAITAVMEHYAQPNQEGEVRIYCAYVSKSLFTSEEINYLILTTILHLSL